MKKQIFAVAALSLCLVVAPAWAMFMTNAEMARADREFAGIAALAERAQLRLDQQSDDNDQCATNSTAAPAVNVWQDLQARAVYKVTYVGRNTGPAQLGETQKERGPYTFFLHIANPQAAKLYLEIVQKHGTLSNWRREKAKSGGIAKHRQLFKKTEGVQHLCTVAEEQIVQRDGGTQTITPVDPQLNAGLIITIESPYSKADWWIPEFEKSPYVFRSFTDENKLKAHIDAYVSRLSESNQDDDNIVDESN